MQQWCDTFPPLNLWNYNLYYKWFPHYEIPIEEIVKDFELMYEKNSLKV